MSDLAAALIADVTEGILILRSRDGVAITTGQALERANNIVAGLISNYEIQLLKDQCSTKQGRQE